MIRLHLKWSHTAFTIKSRLTTWDRVELVKLAMELKYGTAARYFYLEAV